MIIDIFLIIASMIISVIGIVFVHIKRTNFGNILNFYLNTLIYLCLGIFFFAFFFLSADIRFTESYALVFWILSIIFWVISLSLLSIIHRFIINFEKKTAFSTLFYSLIIGIIMGLAFYSDAFIINSNNGIYSFGFKNLSLLGLILCYNFLIIGVFYYNLKKFYSKIRDDRSRKMLSILTAQFSISIILYTVFIITQNVIFRYLYTIFYLTGACFTSYYIIKKPFLFIELTNRIYDFIIFHRSGILLYSYNFETGVETDDSLLKGSILIGINHILSNFFNKKDQLGLIKMQNRDIILEYDNNHGYALLLTTNHKNDYIDKAVSNFMDKFTKMNQEKLKKLNGLIDVSEFGNAKQIITEYFHPFI
ncbi:MAG: hypothetical protein ACFE9Q_14655 [Candidatus Hodarchaeota archaeon]